MGRAAGLVVGVVLLSATLLLPGAPVGADVSGQVSSLQAKAALIARQMILEQLQIGGYQQQYATDTERATEDESLLQQTQQRIAADQSRVRRDTAQLARAAVREYVHSGGSTGVTDVLFSGQSRAADKSVYEKVVTGDLSTAIDELHTARSTLSVQQTAQAQLLSEDQAAQSQAAQVLARAQSTQQQLTQQQASVTGQLAVAVAQQQAQQQAAAAAALAANRSIPAPAGAPASTAAGAPAGAGEPVPTLPPFLQCVVKAESGGDYQIVSWTGHYMGAFQFSQPTWNYAARLAGRPDLIGVAPNTASVADQDSLAIALYGAVGEQPWYDPCRGAA